MESMDEREGGVIFLLGCLSSPVSYGAKFKLTSSPLAALQKARFYSLL